MEKKVDGIRYILNTETKVAKVAYQGTVSKEEVVLKDIIEHEGVEYPVTILGEQAFVYCSKLKIITIPSTIQKIEKNVFWGTGNIEVIKCAKGAKLTVANSVLNHSNKVKYVILEEEDLFRSAVLRKYVFNYVADNPTKYNLEKIAVQLKKKKEWVTFLLGTLKQNILTLLFDNNMCPYDVVKDFVDNMSMSTEVKAQFLNYLSTASDEDKKIIVKNKAKKEDIELGIEKCTLKDFKKEWKCTVKDNKIVIKAYNGSQSIANIPSEVDGLSSFLFEKLQESQTLTKIIFTEGVKEIEIKTTSFANCKHLNSIVLPKTLNNFNVNHSTYENWFGLHLPELLTTKCDGEEALFDLGDNQVEKFVVNDGVKWINLLNPTRYSSLNEVVLSPSVQSIGASSFYKCTSLQNINITDNVKEIGGYAFAGCSSLQNVTIPTNSKTIKNGLFFDCQSLDNVVIPKSVTSIDDWAFYSCTSLTKIVIPEGVTNIGKRAFRDCKSLKEVVLPSTLKTIGMNAFSGCESLESINIPNGIDIIDKRVFMGCNSLKNLTLPNTVETLELSCFEDCTSLSDLVIPNSVTTIAKRAFAHCEKLANLKLPDVLPIMDETSFRGCNLVRKMLKDIKTK